MKGRPIAAVGRLPIVCAMTDPRPNEAFEIRAISKAEPEYPKTAKAARTQGIVSVQVSVSGDGNVISASAFNGPSQLRKAAENAARKWVFRPIEIFGEKRQTWGVLTFNFRLPN
jgi:TonB family protein